MFYQNLKFPKVEQSSRASRTKGRPFFYTNFVTTLDGKVQVEKEGYWPIGSKEDYEILTELRAYADCLIHGANLGREFGKVTIKSINKSVFKQMRRVLGKSANLPYYIITTKPWKLEGANVFLLENGSLKKLVNHLKEQGYTNVLVEGGPKLLGSFLKENLIDEVFLTISPKIYGTNESTKNLVEGQLFPPNQIKHLKLISVKRIKDELFLRYRLN